MISNIPNTPIRPEDLTGIKFIFTRNIPNNTAEEAATAAQLMGITSKETALSTLSVVDDVKQEIERIDMEAAQGDAHYREYMDEQHREF